MSVVSVGRMKNEERLIAYAVIITKHLRQLNLVGMNLGLLSSGRRTEGHLMWWCIGSSKSYTRRRNCPSRVLFSILDFSLILNKGAAGAAGGTDTIGRDSPGDAICPPSS
jgi:hypothetical protein